MKNKTFLEQLQEAVGCKYPLRTILENLEDDQIIEEVNIFAKSVAKQSLENAYNSIDTKDVIDVKWTNIHKSVTNPNNIPTV